MEILEHKTQELCVSVLEIEVMPDHVHILLEVNPKISVAKIVGILKGYSSKKLREKYRRLNEHDCLWSNSYFISTVGGAPLKAVKKYIKEQKNV